LGSSIKLAIASFASLSASVYTGRHSWSGATGIQRIPNKDLREIEGGWRCQVVSTSLLKKYFAYQQRGSTWQVCKAFAVCPYTWLSFLDIYSSSPFCCSDV